MRRILVLLLLGAVTMTMAQTEKTHDANDHYEAKKLYEASGQYYDNQKYDSAVIVGEKALPLLRQNGMKDEEAEELSILSVCCMRQSEYDKALQYAKACNKLDHESGDDERISSSLNTIGSIYVAAKQPQEALKYLLQALQYAEKTGLKPRIALTCGSLSETEFALNHYEEAINYIDRAIQLECEEGREAKLRIRLAQKATILAGSGKRQEAVEIFDSIIPYFRTTGNHQSLAISLNKAGQALLEMGNTNEAKQQQAAAYFRESARLCREMDNPYNEMQARRGLYQALWTLNPDSARIELEAFNLLKDSLYNQASAETLARYNAEFGVDELQEQNTSVRRSRTYIIIIGVVLLLLAVVMIERQRKLTALQRKRLSEVTMTLDELRQRYEHAIANDKNEQDKDELTEQDKDFLTKTMNIVTEQMEGNHVNVDELASALAMSTSQFRRRLSAITGETPQNYITNIRMQKARYLLGTQSELSIFEVALRCGYDDQSSFTRVFKRFFGITPSDYLAKIQ